MGLMNYVKISVYVFWYDYVKPKYDEKDRQL